MEAILYELTPYAPLAIIVASFLDILFCTGLFLYGGALLGVILTMLATGMIGVPTLIASATLGTLSGNQLNYWLGYYFHKLPFIQKHIATDRGQQMEHFLHHRGLFFFMVAGRFITFTRPFHALMIGSFHISWRRFLIYDTVISFIWVIVWIIVILFTEDAVRGFLS